MDHGLGKRMQVRIKFLDHAEQIYDAGEPAYATPGSVGLDLRACFPEESLLIEPGERAAVPSGLAIEPDDAGVAGFVFSPKRPGGPGRPRRSAGRGRHRSRLPGPDRGLAAEHPPRSPGG